VGNSQLPSYEVFALRYAVSGSRQWHENFIYPDPHETQIPLAYYVWAAISADRVIVIDTGFTARAAAQRRRTLVADPQQLLAALGIGADSVRDVILTHLHYDHAGNLSVFPNAVFHLQDTEMSYATGRYMSHQRLSQAFDVEDVVTVVRQNFEGRVRFHDGTAEIAPGVSVHRVGGHTAGLQIVRVHTSRGWLVLASDAAHLSANMAKRNPFPIVFHLGDMLEGYKLCESLADRPDMIIPGHDPAVMDLWPRAAGNANIVRVDLEPAAGTTGSTERT
jgi:glyoxylase-like metal-dependent hydrolase (beta-lactamase superfamily II)